MRVLLPLFWRAAHSRLRPVVEVAKITEGHLPNFLTYPKHRPARAGFKAVNAITQWVKKKARRFRNRKHFKIAISFQCGGPDLYPHGSW